MGEVGGNDVQYVVSLLSHDWLLCDPHGPTRLFCPWNFLGKYWSELPFPSPGDLTHSGIEPASPAFQANFLPLNHKGSPTYSEPWKKYQNIFHKINWKIKLRDILQKAVSLYDRKHLFCKNSLTFTVFKIFFFLIYFSYSLNSLKPIICISNSCYHSLL